MDNKGLSKSSYISHSVIVQTLNTPKEVGCRQLEPLRAITAAHEVPFNILEDVAVVNTPEIHMQEHDLWQCLEGQATFVVGGTMINPRVYVDPSGKVYESEIQGDAIENGTTYTLMVGDYLFIPAGEPHLHTSAIFARLSIVKIPKHA